MKLVISSCLLSATLCTTGVLAQNLTITVTNLTHGSHFTPLLVSAHVTGEHLFQIGGTASSSLQAMAEGGDIAALQSDLANVSADVVANPASGLLAPGHSTTFNMTTNDQNTHLSVVAMVLPTNDGFIGLNAQIIPQQPGQYHYLLNAYDAGTEVNDEIINGGGAPGTPGIPADPLGVNGSNATGVTTSESTTTIHIHRGALGDNDASGGLSDLDSRVHRWLNPVARVTVVVN